MSIKLYVPIEVAAAIAGESIYMMTSYVNREHSPIPHKASENGGKKMVEVAGIMPWMRKYVNVGAEVDYSSDVDIAILKLAVASLEVKT